MRGPRKVSCAGRRAPLARPSAVSATGALVAASLDTPPGRPRFPPLPETRRVRARA
ncbi:MAG: hypothetical protein AVDCRST_MAG40-2483 [uncultured Gemmatimonadaceae bacterium]|uniref:Uncharacterized protein n=1 Tax=uncultured Gemmatimonadaceae bacterium TaxID=246130 RepID=A0A6J4LXX8_9BACT|nr:MAG: hypothetical protein AVDCRST_MAG40-2483 [uncultured Gemmatimonadaceae bacterium]